MIGTDTSYTVQRGQNLANIARKSGVGLEHLTFANQLPVQLTATKKQHLRVPLRRILPRERVDNGLVINLPERGGYVFKDGQFAGFFPIAIGTLNRKTPMGHFKVISMQANPTWYPPAWAGRDSPVPPGEDNPLGDRWIGLNSPGLGLHATNAPDSVGGDVSHGCMRTYPGIAHKLFKYVHKGMPVWVIYEPVKFGNDETGRLTAQVFPDVYQHNNSLSRAQAVLRREGLDFPQMAVKQLLSHPDGVTRVFHYTPWLMHAGN